MGLAARALDSGRQETIMAEHRDLVEAGRAGDAARARRVLTRHLEGTRTALHRGFNGRG